MSLDKLVDSTQLDTDLTAVADAIRAKSGGSAQLAFPAGFVSEIGNIPSGGGATEIASGTYTGDGDYRATIPVGNKMPEADFVFHLWMDTSVELPKDSQYKAVELTLTAPGEFVRFDLSSDGEKTAIGQKTYTINDSGTLKTTTPNRVAIIGIYVQNTSFGIVEYQSLLFRVIRSSSGFSVFFNRNNGSCPFVNGATYYWRLFYYGSSPSTDIVEVS